MVWFERCTGAPFCDVYCKVVEIEDSNRPVLAPSSADGCLTAPSSAVQLQDCSKELPQLSTLILFAVTRGFRLRDEGDIPSASSGENSVSARSVDTDV